MKKIIELNQQEISAISGGINALITELAGKAAFAFGVAYLFEKQLVEEVIWKVKQPERCTNINILGPSVLPLSMVFTGLYLLAEDAVMSVKGSMVGKNKT